MRSTLLPLLCVGFVASAQAFDVTLEGAVQSTYVTSQITSAPFDDRQLLEARDEAASFVASAGQRRGVHLEVALRQLRERYPAAREADDLTLAQAILAR